MYRSILTAAALLTALVLTHPAGAIDEVIRKSTEKSSKGTVKSVTKELVSMEDSIGKPFEVPANDIIDIKYGDEPPDLNLGRGKAAAGNIEGALADYAKSAAEAGSDDNIKAEIEFLVARAVSRQALEQDTSKLGDAATKLSGFTSDHPNSYRFYDATFLLGRVQLAQSDFAAAAGTFATLGSAPWPDYKMASQNANARLALKQGDLPKALSAYEAVLALPAPGPAEVSRRNEALLGKAAVQLQQNNAAAALESVVEAIAAADPEDSAVQAEAWILKGDCLRVGGRTKEAILAYLHVPVLFEKEKGHLPSALNHLAQLWPAVDQLERGNAAKQELMETFPDNEWTKKLQ